MESIKVSDNMKALFALIINDENKGALFVYSDEFVDWYNDGPFGENEGSFEIFLKNRLRNGKIY